MAEDLSLERLAVGHGIALAYLDNWGREHRASASTLSALLAAMGVPGQARHPAARREALPPVLVVRADRQPVQVSLDLTRSSRAGRLGWTLHEESGRRHRGAFPPVDPAAAPQDALRLPVTLPAGYHRLQLTRDRRSIGECTLIIAPARCYCPAVLAEGGRIWGPSVQLYALRSGRNWGCGDFTDLATVLDQWSARGADIVGLNPLHALYLGRPAHASPYSPSSRLFLNALYLDVEAIPDFAECADVRALVAGPEFQARLAALRAAPLVDHAGVAAAKLDVLERLYAHFRRHHRAPRSERAGEFRRFCAAGGEPLRHHALYEALQEHFARSDPDVWGWPAWPRRYHDPGSLHVARFAVRHRARVGFYQYLQWQAELQLAALHARSTARGMSIGLYADLAVSIDRAGAEAWAHQGLYAGASSVGAPPDEFNRLGQDWGLPPLVPRRLREAAYAPFIATLRANMRHAGALRIDHVMGLMRLYWVAPGGHPAAGAYVHYPFEDLLGILALESHRNRCLVIGEDLGTVPESIRGALSAAGVLSYRVLLFERNADGEFRAPAAYPAGALVTASTHDLPTLAGWWEGCDIDLRASLGLGSDDRAHADEHLRRGAERAALLRGLEREGLAPAGALAQSAAPGLGPAPTLAIQSFLARSRAQVLCVQLEDVIGEREQQNLPATTTEYPNWRRKIALALEEWPGERRFTALTAALAAERPGPHRLARPDHATALIPRATYRLQLHRDFGFAAASAIVPYLAALGVSHVYCSPYLRARPGSTHGYDIVDHAALNPEIGTTEEFQQFCATLAQHGMGQLLDMVPNHMAVMRADNGWWSDVLEHGPASDYAEYFDIDWAPRDPDLAGKVLLPVLGDHFGTVLERGELALEFDHDAGALSIRYHEHRFPLDPRDYPRVLDRAAALLDPDTTPPAAAAEFARLVAGLGGLPGRADAAATARSERMRDSRELKARLGQLVRAESPLAAAVTRAVASVNGTPGHPATFAAIETLADRQAYRLAYWRVAGDEINYRRFFDVNDLAALRMEHAPAFDATHRFVLGLAAAGLVHGLRIDHPDGLYDPGRYFRQLQERYAELAGVPTTALDAARPRPLYVVAEKIIAPHEQLPESWTVHGTTGYRFATVVNGLFVDGRAEGRIDRTWRAFVADEAVSYEEAVYRGKRTIMRAALAGELTVLATRLLRLARAHRHTRDFTANALRQALAEVVACFPVYRTYLGTYLAEGASAQDRRYVEWAVGRARRRSLAADPTVFEFVHRALLGDAPDGASERLALDYRSFAMRIQQFTSPVAAKGVEDTAFYVFNRLVSLNDVGGDPSVFGTTVAAFHAASADRAARWPHTMLATSTHDNKRSEDARARIDVISEMPAMWRLALRRWSRINRRRKRSVDGLPAPSANDEYLLYQTLLGTFPPGPLDAGSLTVYRGRIQAYMLKAAREAKVHTSWVSPSAEYEAALAGFVEALLGRLQGNLFLDDFRLQLPAFAWYGVLNSVTMQLIKATSPGVPDIYQGSETLDFSLVDPDNRRPVDYVAGRRALEGLASLAALPGATRAARVRELFGGPHDGRAKLWVLWRALALRREQPALFEHGDYLPVAASGAKAAHAVAYARRHGGSTLLVVAGRLFASLGAGVGALPLGEECWADTALATEFLPRGAPLHNVLTGETLEASDTLALGVALANFPGALFVCRG